MTSSLLRRCPSACTSLFSSSSSHRMCPGSPLANFSKDSPYYARPDNGLAPRPFQGMDMRKLTDCPWVNILETRKSTRSGHQWGMYGQNHLDAFDYKDIPMYFSQRTYWNDYTVWQMLKLTYPHVRFALMNTVNLLIAAGPAIFYCLWQQKFEPVELMIDPDEYFENYRWHYYGADLDHHAFEQYLESRRAKKWRDSTIDSKEYIPPQFRGGGGFKDSWNKQH